MEFKSYEYFIKTTRKDIDFINKTMEAYEGIGVVRTLDANEGRIKIISVDCFRDDMEAIIKNWNEKGIEAKIIEEGPWKGVL